MYTCARFRTSGEQKKGVDDTTVGVRGAGAAKERQNVADG